jgi:integrase
MAQLVARLHGMQKVRGSNPLSSTRTSVRTVPGRVRLGANVGARCYAPLDVANVRRSFKKITNSAGLGRNWKPLEFRTSFVSLMSESGVPVEEIARLVGHTSSRTTETVYRRELRPVITTGAEVMDKIIRAS